MAGILPIRRRSVHPIPFPQHIKPHIIDRPAAKTAKNAAGHSVFEVRPFCWTDLTVRLIVMGPVLNRAHSVQFFLDPILVVVTQIFIKFFQEVLD